MEVIEILGYIGAVFIGLVLGLIGGGGSIITVPIFVYLFHLNPLIATAYSLFVVGVASLVGAIKNFYSKTIEYKTAIVFALPTLISVYITRKYIVHAIPDVITSIGNFQVTRELGIMVFFAVIMLLSAISMIRKANPANQFSEKGLNYPLIIFEGLVIGLITGLVGAGGGFLIIPSLVILARLPMKKAVATSLLIISINSLIGFIGDLQNIEVHWNFLLTFTSVAVVGIILGVWLNKYIDGQKLKKGFGYFVLIMGVFILFQELYAAQS